MPASQHIRSYSAYFLNDDVLNVCFLKDFSWSTRMQDGKKTNVAQRMMLVQISTLRLLKSTSEYKSKISMLQESISIPLQ